MTFVKKPEQHFMPTVYDVLSDDEFVALSITVVFYEDF
jgi:hypothetical protein